MRYLMAIFLVLSAVLGFCAYFYYQKSESYCELWKNAQANSNFLIKVVERNNEKALEASRRAEELEELVKLSSESCWNRVIPNSDSVLVRLHQD